MWIARDKETKAPVEWFDGGMVPAVLDGPECPVTVELHPGEYTDFWIADGPRIPASRVEWVNIDHLFAKPPQST